MILSFICFELEEINLYYFQMSRRRFTKVPKKPHVFMHISTWNKDSHGLYDFDSSAENYEQQQLFIDKSASIFRNFQQQSQLYNIDATILQEKSNKREVDSCFRLIGSIIIDKRQDKRVFKLQSEMKKEENYPHSFYEVYRENTVENNTSQGYGLKPGTIIKFGRVEYIVLEIKANNEVKRIRETNLYHEGNGVFEVKASELDVENFGESEVNCKICCCNEQTEDNPLISPCLCKGSCAKIHLGCLRQWITSKVKKQIGNHVNSYNFTKFECQLCKHPFPRVVKIRNEQYEMMKINKPENRPYLMLESLAKTQNEERCLHLIEGKECLSIRIGRNYQSEIRITDISVSRSHALISYKDGTFYIKDQKSKFGTLIKLSQNEITLSAKSVYRIQLGRVLYQFQVKGEQEDCDSDTE